MSHVPAIPSADDVIVNPASGELILLTDHRACARALDSIIEMENRMREVKAELRRAIAEEAARQGTKTLDIGGGMKATVTVRRDITWDMEVLERLRDAGLPEERWDALVRPHVEYKVSAQIASQIAGANPEYARIIELARSDEEAAPSVSLRRR